MGLSLTCLVDNTAQLSSRLWGEHGLCVLVESLGARVLFDTGQSGEVLAHNLDVLQTDLRGCQSLVLSHGHDDHTGGLQVALERTGPLDVYAHPGVLEKRYSRRPDGSFEAVGISMRREDIDARSRLHLSAEPQRIAEGMHSTGRIRRTAASTPFDSQLVVRRGSGWVPDPFDDDLALVIDIGRGLVVLLGCCHAGLVNTLAHVRTTWKQPIVGLVGGTHLVAAEPQETREAIAAVRDDFQVQRLVLGHCTGALGYSVFDQAMPERVEPLCAGLHMEF